MKDNVRHFFYSKSRNSKSVRKNCFWFEYGNKKYLVSYQTVVCSIDDKGRFEKYWNDYSATTLNQINAFIGLFGKDTVIRSDTGEIINSIGKYNWLEMETTFINILVYDYAKKYIPDIEYFDNPHYRVDYVKKIVYN